MRRSLAVRYLGCYLGCYEGGARTRNSRAAIWAARKHENSHADCTKMRHRQAQYEDWQKGDKANGATVAVQARCASSLAARRVSAAAAIAWNRNEAAEWKSPVVEPGATSKLIKCESPLLVFGHAQSAFRSAHAGTICHFDHIYTTMSARCEPTPTPAPAAVSANAMQLSLMTPLAS